MDRKKGVYLFAVEVIALMVLVVFYFVNQSTGKVPRSARQYSEQNSTSIGGETIAQEELTKHNSDTDCWISYWGKVYDVTSWLPKHPGGAKAITPYCGTSSEFENAFTGQHGTSKVELLDQVGTYKGELSN